AATSSSRVGTTPSAYRAAFSGRPAATATRDGDGRGGEILRLHLLTSTSARSPMCCSGVQLTVLVHREPPGLLSEHVRVGVHVGEVELVGGRVRGIAAHEAARVIAAAGPDEILVSEIVRTLQ